MACVGRGWRRSAGPTWLLLTLEPLLSLWVALVPTLEALPGASVPLTSTSGYSGAKAGEEGVPTGSQQVELCLDIGGCGSNGAALWELQGGQAEQGQEAGGAPAEREPRSRCGPGAGEVLRACLMASFLRHSFPSSVCSGPWFSNGL